MYLIITIKKLVIVQVILFLYKGTYIKYICIMRFR